MKSTIFLFRNVFGLTICQELTFSHYILKRWKSKSHNKSPLFYLFHHNFSRQWIKVSDFIAKTDARRSKQARFVTFGFSLLDILLFPSKSIFNVFSHQKQFWKVEAHTNWLCNRFLKNECFLFANSFDTPCNLFMDIHFLIFFCFLLSHFSMYSLIKNCCEKEKPIQIDYVIDF